MTSKGTILGVIVAVAIIGGLAVYALSNQGVVSQFNISQPTINLGTTPSTSIPTGFQIYGKNFNVQTATTDALDVAITYGDDAELDTICWDARGSDDVKDWVKLGSFSEAETGDANIDVDEGILNADGSVKSNGTTEMWCEFNLESSQDFFVDQEKIIRANDRIDSCIFEDANDDNDGTWICRYNLVGITTTADPNAEPSDTLQVYLFDEDADATLIDTATADVGSIAQGSVSTEAQVNIDFNNAGDAIVISDIRFRNNLTTTDSNLFNEDTEICFEDSTAKIVWFDTRLPVGCLQLNDRTLFDKDLQASTTEWFWTSGNTYEKGILITVGKNQGVQVDTFVNFKSEFSSSADGICFEVAYKYIDAFQTKSAYDAVDIEMSAYASGSTGCTIT